MAELARQPPAAAAQHAPFRRRQRDGEQRRRDQRGKCDQAIGGGRGLDGQRSAQRDGAAQQHVADKAAGRERRHPVDQRHQAGGGDARQHEAERQQHDVEPGPGQAAMRGKPPRPARQHQQDQGGGEANGLERQVGDHGAARAEPVGRRGRGRRVDAGIVGRIGDQRRGIGEGEGEHHAGAQLDGAAAQEVGGARGQESFAIAGGHGRLSLDLS